MISKHEVGERLADVLRQSGLSQRRFAERASISHSAVSKVISGTQWPTPEMLTVLADDLLINLHWLYTGVPTPGGSLSEPLSADPAGHISRLIELAAQGPDGELRLARLEGYLSSLVAQAADAAAGVDEEAGRGAGEAQRRTA